MGKIIGVVSLKGGVGKTSAVCSLGEAISRQGKKVLLVDGNFSAPNLSLYLDMDHNNSVQDVLRNKVNMRDAIYKAGSFDVMPSMVFYNHKMSPLKLKDKLKYLRKEYDYILVDSSPSLGEETLSVMLASDELFVVTTPDLPTLGMTVKAIKSAKQRGTPINGLILNKSYKKKFEIDLDEIEEVAEVPVLAVLPHDVNVVKSVSKYKPITRYKPRSEVSKEFMRLASSITGEKYKGIGLKDFIRSVKPKRQDVNRTCFYERVFA